MKHGLYFKFTTAICMAAVKILCAYIYIQWVNVNNPNPSSVSCIDDHSISAIWVPLFRGCCDGAVVA